MEYPITGHTHIGLAAASLILAQQRDDVLSLDERRYDDVSRGGIIVTELEPRQLGGLFSNLSRDGIRRTFSMAREKARDVNFQAT